MSLSRKGFTLIELLVVIAIIAILAAILFPVFARARAKANQTSCLSNVKEMTLGVLMYTQDYDGHLPAHYRLGPTPVTYPGGGTSSGLMWYFVIYPYVKNMQVFNCPSSNYAWNGNYTGGLRYGYSRYLSDQTLDGLDRPAETFLLSDSDYNPGESALSYVIYTGWNARTFIAPRHNEGANIGLIDGHAKWFKVEEGSHHPVRDILIFNP